MSVCFQGSAKRCQLPYSASFLISWRCQLLLPSAELVVKTTFTNERLGKMFLASQSSREQLETVRGGPVVRMRCLVVVSPLETAVRRHDEHARALMQMCFTCLSPVRLNELPLSVSLVWLRLPWFSLAEFSRRLVFPQSFQDVWSQAQSHQTTDLSLSVCFLFFCFQFF